MLKSGFTSSYLQIKLKIEEMLLFAGAQRHCVLYECHLDSDRGDGNSAVIVGGSMRIP